MCVRADDGQERSCEANVAILVMGVAGCGKSSVASAVAKRLGGVLIEGDSYHSQENIQKMRAGQPLTDHDRLAWLTHLNAVLRRTVAAGELPVLACSALKADYRGLLEAGLDALLTVFLQLPPQVAEQRVASRRDHYMPASLVQSQFADLEPPAPGAGVLAVDACLPLQDILNRWEAWWSLPRQ
jgi:gluconokinase